MDSIERPGSAAPEQINRLYWDSDQTVDELVGQLGITRGALYAAVRPNPAGANCPDCGERLAFANRSSRSAGVATCTGCDAEVDLSHASASASTPPADSFGDARASNGDGMEPTSGWARWRGDLAAVAPERAALIGGAAALGVVLGAAAARAVRDR